MNKLVALVALSITTTTATADQWLPATPETYTSRRGAYRLTVFPRELAGPLAYFQDKVSGTDAAGQRKHGQERCEATLEKLVDNHYEQLWRKPLVNDVAPVSALVSDADGSFITFDNWHSMGWGDNAIVVYRSDGELTRKLPLTAIMSKKQFENLPRSVSSIHWSGEHELDPWGRVALVRIVTGSKSDDPDKKYKTVRIHLGTAQVLQ
jgi:hypothetical protein